MFDKRIVYKYCIMNMIVFLNVFLVYRYITIQFVFLVSIFGGKRPKGLVFYLNHKNNEAKKTTAYAFLSL